MSKSIQFLFSVNELQESAKRVLAHCPNEKMFVFYGEMGAGKTTLITALCEELGVTDGVSSPTYSLVNQYEGGKKPVYHFDLFRIKSLAELLDIGFEEYLDEEAILFIEWPQLAEQFLDSYTEIRLETIDENSRELKLMKIG
ncbi:tRNA (adenosine(37)-N6)-threonylcarbamoyltransferase complex ATPase subunit type 1 TsaE [Chitinophagales bacterium]|nr:tRNA (adenosine(37)-N6)-threonylcarbamoyltransferase complex ATPase subunit type 1 TsaE [Chitinophagales bacterium]